MISYFQHKYVCILVNTVLVQTMKPYLNVREKIDRWGMKNKKLNVSQQIKNIDKLISEENNKRIEE